MRITEIIIPFHSHDNPSSLKSSYSYPPCDRLQDPLRQPIVCILFFYSYLMTKSSSRFLRFTKRIVELHPEESDDILAYLFRHISENHDLQVRYKWALNDVAIWDNRATFHTATYVFSLCSCSLQQPLTFCTVMTTTSTVRVTVSLVLVRSPTLTQSQSRGGRTCS